MRCKAQITVTLRTHLLPDIWSLPNLFQHPILQLTFLLFKYGSAFTHGPTTTSGAGIMDCTALSAALPGLVYAPGTPEYADSTGTYFSAFENELEPFCILQPQTVQEVAKVIKYLNTTPTGVQITIRGGGHTTWAGAANIENGITLDLRKLRGVTLNLMKGGSFDAN
jgi:hypothetical protein